MRAKLRLAGRLPSSRTGAFCCFLTFCFLAAAPIPAASAQERPQASARANDTIPAGHPTAPESGESPADAAPPPRIAYAGYPADERISIDGAEVHSETEAAGLALYSLTVDQTRATQDYMPAPAIWRIGDADTTIYLFGTIHQLPIGFRWRNPELERVIAASDVLLLETIVDFDETPEDALAPFLLPSGTLPPLTLRIPPAQRPALKALLGMFPPEMAEKMNRMPSWIAAIMLASLRGGMAGEIAGPGADDWLQRHFQRIGRQVEEIEDSTTVFRNVSAVPEEEQRQMLSLALSEPLDGRHDLDAMAHAWAVGDVSERSPLILAPGAMDPAGALNAPILDQRNTAWTDHLLLLLDTRTGTMLFAAGAAHFVGTGSVLDLLRARGIAVERVQ